MMRKIIPSFLKRGKGRLLNKIGASDFLMGPYKI
jgi:hypothetical protein